MICDKNKQQEVQQLCQVQHESVLGYIPTNKKLLDKILNMFPCGQLLFVAHITEMVRMCFC